MDKKQKEMLSVKSAIERTIQSYISTYTTLTGNNSKEFFQAVERSIAAFFVSSQIDNNYIVRSTTSGDVEVYFSSHGHCTCLTMLLPESLKWKLDVVKQIPSNIVKADVADEWKVPYIDVGTMNAEKVKAYLDVVKSEIRQQRIGSNPRSTEDVYNPRALEEDFFFPSHHTRGSKVETLPPVSGAGVPITVTTNDLRKEYQAQIDDLLAEEGSIAYDTIRDETLVYKKQKGWTVVSEDVVLEGTIRRGKNGRLEIAKNGNWIAVPVVPGVPGDLPSPPTEQVQEDPSQAYERAKKAVETMK